MWNWTRRAAFADTRSKRLLFLRLYQIFQKPWNMSRWNFHYKFAFLGECGADEGGVSRKFHSGNVVDSCQRITETFPGATFEILFIRSEKWVDKTVSMRYLRKLGFNIFLKLSSYLTYFSDLLIQLKHIPGFYTCPCKYWLYPSLLQLMRAIACAHARQHMRH